MKKVKKTIVLSSILVGIIGISGILYQQKNDESQVLNKEIKHEVQAYNYNPNNILDNVFEKDGLNILPFIYKNSEEQVSIENVKKQFTQAGLTITNISTNSIVTGTKITTNQKTYTVVIYGDVDGDGFVDVFDAQAVLLHYVFGEQHTLTGIYRIAANVDNEDDELDVFDAQRILLFYVGNENKLVVNEPLSEKEMDKQPPIITLKGSNPQYINFGDRYIESGANVADNLDKNVAVKIDSSNVNTNKIGTYFVTYNAKDASGNLAKEVKRTVIVKDYVKSIQVIKPTKTVYEVNEELNVEGGKINVIYASGKIEEVAMTSSMLSGYNNKKLGKQIITVNYQGMTGKFEIEVVPQPEDYVTGIEIIPPTKTTYKYGQTIDLSGAKFRKIMNSGAIAQQEVITSDMLDIIEPKIIGKNTITVSYTTNNTIDDTEKIFTKTFDVTVENYVLDIVLETAPTKITYKYGQNIDTEGMLVKSIMANGEEKDITSNVTADITNVKLQDNKVVLKYITNETIDNKEKEFNVSFNITVENYITGIEIAKNPTKMDYTEGETISLEGMIVNAINADNSKQAIDIANITFTPEQVEYGKETITINYTTNNTIDDKETTFNSSFNISVLKKVSTIEVTPKDILEGYRYETIYIADVQSGENEETITTDKLSWTISKNGQEINDESIAKVMVEQDLQFGNGQIAMRFQATQEGTYVVTPKVDNILGNSIEVRIYESTVVTEISLDEIAGKFRVNTPQNLGITFYHQYNNGEKVEIDVQANRITLEVENVEYKLLNGDVIAQDNSIVKSVNLKGTQSGSAKVTIIVDKNTSNEIRLEKNDIHVLEAAKISVDLGDIQEITLYSVNQSSELVQVDDGDIYTLIPICLKDEDGKVIKLTANNVIGTDAVVTIEDTNYNAEDEFSIPLITKKCYKKIGSNIVEATGEEEIDYVGIAPFDKDDIFSLRGEEIKVTYIGENTKGENKFITINVPQKEITQINVTEADNLVGYRFKTFDIATVKSGAGEETITTSNLNCIITKDNQEITDENVAKVILAEDQFDSEQVKMSFVASQAGTYVITPKVGTIEGNSITVQVDEDQLVTEIDLDEKKLVENKAKNLEVTFYHQYDNNEKVEIEVQKKRITIEVLNAEYNLLTRNLDVISRDMEVVKYINLKPAQVGTAKVVITVDKGTTNEIKLEKSIEILSQDSAMSVSVGNIDSITLYKNMPANSDGMVQQDGEDIYTLIPVSLIDEDGNTAQTKLTIKDIADLDAIVSIEDSEYNPDDEFAMPLLAKQYYKQTDSGIIAVTDENEEIDYVGIAPLYKEDIDDLVNVKLNIKCGNNQTTLDIIVSE